MSEPKQLERLARPFPQRLIHENPSGGGSYVKHSVVTEKLLAVLGPFSFELVDVIRGHVPAIEPNPQGKSARAKRGSPPLSEAVVGAVCRLSVTVDGRFVRVEEVGDCEDPQNWPHDGARLKDAMSDALKRCAMRLGVTLHLWSGAEFTLYDQLKSSGPPTSASSRASGGSEPSEGAGPDEEAQRAGPRTSAPSSSGPPAPATPHRSEPRGPEPPVTVPSSVTAAEPEDRPPTATSGSAPDPWFVPPSRMARAKSRVGALLAAKVSVADERTKRVLPPLNEEIGAEEFELWCVMLDELEARLPA